MASKATKVIENVIFGTMFACSFVGAGAGLLQGGSTSLDYVNSDQEDPYLHSVIIAPAIVLSGAVIGTVAGAIAGAVSPIVAPIYIGYKFKQEQLK